MNSATDSMSPASSFSPALPAPRPRMRLAWHLAIVLLVKVILLALLWNAFIKPNKVKVDVDLMGVHITRAASVSLPTSPGDPK